MVDVYEGRLRLLDKTREDLYHAVIRIEVDGLHCRWSFLEGDEPVSDPLVALERLRDQVDRRRKTAA